ncbi:UDP-glucuronosyltransferase 2B15-like [Hyposmocoma kahamanoa]|uniref:UDP-glucuronosyltransferase 2B15-like n=1 Tax=Hyposmocoma kahamanoa TaxID=1477025 RepID=UPI000E6D7819|nr:UDP-glucuronosyltransferase 2B15-like [Hyposmocoma kahamanoa]
MRWFHVGAVLILSYVCHVQCSSILALFSSLSHSDHFVFRGLATKLAQRGHNVVMMTPYPGHFTYPEIEKIVELDVGQESGAYWDEFKNLMSNTEDYYTRMRAINEFNVKLAISQLKSKQMTALFINPNIKFDLVITEADVPVLYAVADKYKVPHIAITTTSGKIHQYEAKGNQIHPILYPDVNTLNYGNLNLWQTLVEVNRYIQTRNEYYNNYLPLCEIAAKRILGLKRNLIEVEQDIDVLFIAANPLLVGNRPTVPSTVFTDLLQIVPGLSLPKSLKTALDAARKGAIYFTIGAVQESEELAPHILQTLADAFSQLPFTVLWKIENVTINKPDNVIAHPWFPQQEVLAHPNVKAFITHGGLRSLEEAVYYEVPIIGLPIVKSRKPFLQLITRHGAGEIIDPYHLEKDSLKSIISVVATNDRYKKAMTTLKAKIVNNLNSGPENAVWWTEYVLRNGGARHLRAPAVGVTTREYYLLDIVLVFLLGGVVILWLATKILLSIARTVGRKFQKKNIDYTGKFKAL